VQPLRRSRGADCRGRGFLVAHFGTHARQPSKDNGQQYSSTPRRSVRTSSPMERASWLCTARRSSRRSTVRSSNTRASRATNGSTDVHSRT
jgi:hypothetical protein